MYFNFSPITSLITLLALLVYLLSIVNVTRARLQHKVQPSATSGPDDFERVFQVQQNNLEQLALFLPAFWIFSYFVSSWWGACLGVIWVLSRLLYMYSYYLAASRLLVGFVISATVSSVLLLGGLIGTILAILPR